MSDGNGPCEAIILGSGTSHGVPMIGCTCPVCTSTDPRDKRTRCSVVVRYAQQQLMVDTATEMRLQCIACGIDRVDGILFTHHHADHVSGLDDLRRFNWLTGEVVRCYGTARTLCGLRKMFRYAFEDDPHSLHTRPALETVTIEHDPFMIGGARIVPLPLIHGNMEVLGYRFGDFAYCTDCNDIPLATLARMEGLDVLVMDAVRRRPHPAHFNIEQGIAMAQRIGARRTYFTHIAHSLLHAEVEQELPEGISLAYDGLRLELT